MDLVSAAFFEYAFSCLSFYPALKADDIVALKTKFGFSPEQKFHVPQETYDAYAKVAKRGAAAEASWNELLASYGKKYPTEHAELTRRIAGKLPEGWEKSLPVYKTSDPAQASRKLSEIVLTALTPVIPDLVGGSADLTGSNLTKVFPAASSTPVANIASRLKTLSISSPLARAWAHIRARTSDMVSWFSVRSCIFC
jgi:transketolase